MLCPVSYSLKAGFDIKFSAKLLLSSIIEYKPYVASHEIWGPNEVPG